MTTEIKPMNVAGLGENKSTARLMPTERSYVLVFRGPAGYRVSAAWPVNESHDDEPGAMACSRICADAGLVGRMHVHARVDGLSLADAERVSLEVLSDMAARKVPSALKIA